MPKKLCKKSSFEVEFKNLVTFHWMSQISLNLFSFEASLSRGNRMKSGGLNSGENGGCSNCTPSLFARNCLTILAVWASIVLNRKSNNLVVRTGVVLYVDVHKTIQNSNVRCSIHPPAVMRTINRRSCVINLLTFSLSKFPCLKEIEVFYSGDCQKHFCGFFENG
ncbi:hypothetical protein TNCV_949281 [Trichonephila clavipes]|nr:hypothetical protein TNCV_949281 [Trichonephila clavipes]